MKKKLASLFLVLAMCLGLCVPAFAADTESGNPSAGIDILLDSKDIVMVFDPESNTGSIIDADDIMPYDSSLNTLFPNYSHGTISLHYIGGSNYYVRFELSTYNDYTISRIIFKIRPSNTSSWTKLDKAYTDSPESITEDLDFTYSGSSSDLSVTVYTKEYINTGGLLDSTGSGTRTLDFN